MNPKFPKIISHLGFGLLAGLFGLAAAFLVTRVGPIAYQRLMPSSSATLYSNQVAVVNESVPNQVTSPASFEVITQTLSERPATGRFIEADLRAMTIALYENGALVESLPILAKGKIGSPWETPGGVYQILGKELDHFSSIGKVHMPYSLQFFGNFFIHGWPYYPDGTPVSANYSGGCIRLSTESAAKVFAFSVPGTPLRILDHSLSAPDRSMGSYRLNPGVPPRGVPAPNLSADAYLVADLLTGDVIVGHNKDQVLPIASITKLFSTLVSLEVVNQFQEATVSAEALATYGESGGLVLGERISTGDLLYPLLLESSNDAAEVLARHFGRSSFIRHLNEKAQAIGLTKTSLVDPSGIGDQNISTASDLFKLFRYIHHGKAYVLSVLKKSSYQAAGHQWVNNSEQLATLGYLGGKSGHTNAAGDTFLGGFNVPFGNTSRSVVVVVLGSENRQTDVQTLLSYLKTGVSFVPTPKEVAEPTRLIFVGDIMLDRGVEGVVKRHNNDFSWLFEKVPELESADIAFGNLEGPLSDQGKDRHHLYSFRMNPEALPAIKEAGFDIFSLANNHAGDWGQAAFTDTIKRLTASQIKVVGGGMNAAEAEKPQIIEHAGKKYGFLAFTDVGPDWLAAAETEAGLLLASDPRREEIIAQAKKVVDTLIVSYHFGDEYQKEPSARQIMLAKSAIDAGAKLVIGHHPHVTQPVERYNNGLIAYSLGNFIFDQNFSPETMQGMALEVLVREGDIISFEEHPVSLNAEFQPSF